MNERRRFVTGIALGIFTVFLGAGVAAIAKFLSAQISVATIVLWQYGVCFLLTLPGLQRAGLRSLKTDRKWLHLIRGVSGCICFYTYYLALVDVSLVDATLLRNTAPLWVPIVIFLWLGVGVDKRRWPPLIIGFIGILIILRPGQHGVSTWHLWALVSGLSLAVSMVTTRELAATEPEPRILFYYFVTSLLFALPFFIANSQPLVLETVPWLVGMGVGLYFTFVCYTRAYAYVAAADIAPTSYFAVVFTGVIEWLVWSVVPDAWTLIGTALVVAGGIMVLRLRQAA